MSLDLKHGQFARTLNTPEAQRLADLTGLRRDLRLVRESCFIIESRKGSPSAAHIRRACFDSAVMRYRRCFNGGIRDLFPRELLLKLTSNQKALHDRILELANRSIAHCVDGSEDNVPYFVYDKSVEPARISVHVYTRTTSHHNKIKIQKFAALAGKLEKLLAEEGVRVSKKVLKAIQKMPGEEAAALPVVQPMITDDGEELKPKYRAKSS